MKDFEAMTRKARRQARLAGLTGARRGQGHRRRPGPEMRIVIELLVGLLRCLCVGWYVCAKDLTQSVNVLGLVIHPQQKEARKLRLLPRPADRLLNVSLDFLSRYSKQAGVHLPIGLSKFINTCS